MLKVRILEHFTVKLDQLDFGIMRQTKESRAGTEDNINAARSNTDQALPIRIPAASTSAPPRTT